FDGAPVDVVLDPRLDAAGNAAARYDQARRRVARAKRATDLVPELTAAVAAAESDLAGVAELPATAVAARLQAATKESEKAGARAAVPGIRFKGPHGFEVVVGRNARDNDKVTFQVARSRDLWLHAQGYRGSHVVVRSGGKDVPFDTVLFAARLAAGHSEARREDRVAVDYTERKNVWRPKGGAPGAVNFAHHRTVVVAPARDDEGAKG
ncbi:MAG TPA: NFACT RNA binding domain-containing protein, partial [Trueperaceae bacterium]|nr:NFACT RNA binding domain-containing protein [Trueperaceae bacterium]